MTGFRVFTITLKTVQVTNGTDASLVSESLLSKKVCLYKNKKTCMTLNYIFLEPTAIF